MPTGKSSTVTDSTKTGKNTVIDPDELYRTGLQFSSNKDYDLAVNSWNLAAQSLHFNAVVALAFLHLDEEKSFSSKNKIKGIELLLMAYLLVPTDLPTAASLEELLQNKINPLTFNYCQKLKSIFSDSPEDFESIYMDYSKFEVFVTLYLGIIDVYEYFYANSSPVGNADQLARQSNFCKLLEVLSRPRPRAPDLVSPITPGPLYKEIFNSHVTKAKKSYANMFSGTIFSNFGIGKQRYLDRLNKFSDIVNRVDARLDEVLSCTVIAFKEAICRQAAQALDTLKTERGVSSLKTAQSVLIYVRAQKERLPQVDIVALSLLEPLSAASTATAANDNDDAATWVASVFTTTTHFTAAGGVRRRTAQAKTLPSVVEEEEQGPAAAAGAGSSAALQIVQ